MGAVAVVVVLDLALVAAAVVVADFMVLDSSYSQHVTIVSTFSQFNKGSNSKKNHTSK